MKQGILLTAYNEIDHLKKLINFFNDDFYIYIHMDKKSKLSKEDIDAIQHAKNVVFLSREFKINWGGIYGMMAILLLAKEALKNKEIEYFHVISGQDFPIKSCEFMSYYLTKHKGKEFIEYFKMPENDWHDTSTGLSRIGYYNFYDLFNAKTKIGYHIISMLFKAQRILNIKRNVQFNFPNLFSCATWWSVSYPCLKYIVDFTDNNPQLLKRFDHTFAPDEIYFSTILMNSPFKDSIENNNLRYINWAEKNGSRPAILDESDYDNIVKSDALFARKFQPLISKNLIQKVESHIAKMSF